MNFVLKGMDFVFKMMDLYWKGRRGASRLRLVSTFNLIKRWFFPLISIHTLRDSLCFQGWLALLGPDRGGTPARSDSRSSSICTTVFMLCFTLLLLRFCPPCPTVSQFYSAFTLLCSIFAQFFLQSSGLNQNSSFLNAKFIIFNAEFIIFNTTFTTFKL